MTDFGRWLGKLNADCMLDELFMEDLTKGQFRAVWTTYCLIIGLEPDTFDYDSKLREVYTEHWCYEENYEEYDLFMGKLLS